MKKKLLLTSILSIVMCFSLICGATFALFTSESKVNIAVTSGTVAVEATLGDEVKLSSDGVDRTEAGYFANGGTVFVEGQTASFTSMMPGDSATFTINVKNLSDVEIMSRIVITAIDDTGLFKALEISIDGVTFSGYTMSNWTNDLTEKAVEVTITLPMETDDKYQTKSCGILFKVEAVQGNAVSSTPTTATQLENALNYGGEVTLGGNIELDEKITVKSDAVATLNFNGYTISTKDGFTNAAAIENNGNLTIINGVNAEENVEAAAYGMRMMSTFAATYEEETSAEVGGITSSTTAIENNGELTINGGAYSAASGAVIKAGENSTATINGGEFTATENAVIIDGAGYFKITDGTFSGELPDVLPDGVAFEKNEDGSFKPAENIAVSENELTELLAAGGKVYLGANIEVTSEIEIPDSATVTLDLNGKNITSAYQKDSTTKHIYPLNNYGNLTIIDSGSKGCISGRGVYNQDGAVLTVNGAKIVGEDFNGGACVWSYGTGKVYLNDAVLVGNTGVVSSEGYLEINGGTYTCYSGIADDGTQLTAPTYNVRAYNGLKITDGTFTSRHGVISIGGGEAVIEGGSFTIKFASATTSNVVYAYGSVNLTINGGEFLSDDTSGKADSGAAVFVSGSNAKVTINDGTYVGMNGMVDGNTDTVLCGGTFNTVWDYNHYDNLKDKIAEGYTATQNDDGSWTVAKDETSN